jgi:hypothetical protein
MKKFTDWLNETHYSFGNTKPASEWRNIWLQVAKNYLTKMKQEDLIDHVDAIVLQINEVRRKLEDLGNEPLSSNQVAVLAGDEDTGNPDLDAHFQALVDAIERME